MMCTLGITSKIIVCHEHQLLHHLVTAGASLGHLTSSALSSAVSAAITGPWIVKFVQFRYIYMSTILWNHSDVVIDTIIEAWVRV